MMMSYPTSRSVRHALDVLERLPLEALADLAERLIDRIDAAEALDLDLEPDDFDACPAEDVAPPNHLGVGDADDAEENGDENEPDTDDLGASEDEPDFRNTLERPDGIDGCWVALR